MEELRIVPDGSAREGEFGKSKQHQAMLQLHCFSLLVVFKSSQSCSAFPISQFFHENPYTVIRE